MGKIEANDGFTLTPFEQECVEIWNKWHDEDGITLWDFLDKKTNKTNAEKNKFLDWVKEVFGFTITKFT